MVSPGELLIAPAFAAIPIILLALLIVALLRLSGIMPGSGPRGAGDARGPAPLETLEQRYARGEIDTADFEERRARLARDER